MNSSSDSHHATGPQQFDNLELMTFGDLHFSANVSKWSFIVDATSTIRQRRSNCILGNILKAQPLQYNKLVKVKFDNFYVEM